MRLISRNTFGDIYYFDEKNNVHLSANELTEEQIEHIMERLANYEDMIDKASIPPVKIGDKFWKINYHAEVIPMYVSMIQQKKDRSWKVRFTAADGDTYDYAYSQLGIYFWETEEEARKNLPFA